MGDKVGYFVLVNSHLLEPQMYSMCDLCNRHFAQTLEADNRLHTDVMPVLSVILMASFLYLLTFSFHFISFHFISLHLLFHRVQKKAVTK